jgi:NAD(P)-dependent dehydrogenase (short-subunit alcohol dehydrogenase family)
MTLEDKRVVVMGGSSGIGRATAKAASALGAEVIITGRDEEKLQDAVARLGNGASGQRVDAAERDQLKSFFDNVERLDHLVLALGGAAGGGPIASLELDDLRAGFDGKFWPHLTALQVGLPGIDTTGSVTFISAGSAGAFITGTVLTVDGGLRFTAAA